MKVSGNKSDWKMLYKICFVAVFLTIIIMVSEIILSSFPDGSRTDSGVGEINEWFALFDRNWFMAMRNLGLINIIATTLTIPLYFSLFGLHYENNTALAGFSLVLFALGYAVFMADNVAFPMLALSWKYAGATAESKEIFLAAGEALLAKGISHTPGTFPGFILSESAAILVSLLIIVGGKIKKGVGVLGLVSFLMMIIFEILSSFYPNLFSVSMIFAMIGGILALIWYLLLGINFYRFSK